MSFLKEALALLPDFFNHVIYAGAGTGDSVDLIRTCADGMTLLEASPRNCNILKQKFNSIDNLTVVPKALGIENGSAAFYITKPSSYSSLVSPTLIKHFYPNFETLKSLQVETITLDSLIEEIPLPSEKANLLVLDICGFERELFESLEHLTLEDFEYVIVRTSIDSLYKSKDILNFDSINNDLVRLGFINRTIKTSVPPFITLLASRNRASFNLTASDNAIEEQINRFNCRQEELIEEIKSKEGQIVELTMQKERESHRASKYQKLVNELEGKLTEKEGQLSTALNSIVSKKELEIELGELVKSQAKFFTGQQRKLDGKLSRGLNNSVKQIESFIGVQKFLETGQFPMEFHGWPISSDIALFLLGLLFRNNYDLIIEFGSGTSTLLFAKSLQMLCSKQSRTRILDGQAEHHLEGTIDNRVKEKSFSKDNLRNKVISFEHNEKYFQKSKDVLVEHDLDCIVNLVHAPLVEYLIDEELFMFYDCDEHLESVSKMCNGGKAKILVLVDGPPGATGPLARLPALQKLLHHLSGQQLDLVLDDFNRPEEKQTALKWKALLEAMSIDFEEESIPTEKGAYFCQINA